MVYAVIMAGGKGTRLWPQSREDAPKQLWGVLDGQSMLQDTVTRIAPIIPPEKVLIITGENIYDQICQQLPSVPPRHVIVEPMGKSTAPCVGLAALYINNPEACMVILAADHVIRDQPEFRRVLQTGIDIAADGEHLVTFGIKPTGPETGFGYIHRDEMVRAGVYKVRQFTEKPNFATAKQFVESGEYYWNSGMFVWKASTLLTMIERYLPDLYQGLMIIKPAIGTPDERRVIAEVFDRLDAVSIDYGIMEKAETTYVVPGDFGWSDVGSWAAIPDIWETNEDGNTLQGQVLTLDSYGNIVYSDTGLTALVGVDGLVVVRVRDAVLVCHKTQAQKVKDIVNQLEKNGLKEFL